MNMGSRGAFQNVEKKDFTFIKDGETYTSIGMVDDIKVLVRNKGYSVKAPEYSHSPSSKYAIVQDGYLKHVSYYDENHKQAISIDLLHKHDGLKPHKHIYLDHSTGLSLTNEQQKIVDKIRRRFNLR